MHHVQTSDYRVLIALCVLTCAAVLPFTVLHVINGFRSMALVTGTMVATAAGCAAWIYRERSRPELIRRISLGIVLVGNVIVLLAVLGQQDITIYWIYPLIFTNFYLLPLRAAMVVNLVVSPVILFIVYGEVPDAHLARLAGSIPLCIMFGYIFSSAITRQRLAYHRLANFDALTGMGNRRNLEQALDDATNRYRRYDEVASLVFLDIDYFKTVNDEVGHLRGDEIIRQFAVLLDSRIRRTDRVFRFGGEEFVILMPHTSLAEARHVAEALRSAVRTHEFQGGKSLTCSAGVTEIGPEDSREVWLERADGALYRAKRAGRDRVVAASAPGHPDPESAIEPSDRKDPVIRTGCRRRPPPRR